MRKSLVLTLLAASSVLATGTTLCLAADAPNMASDATHEATHARPSQRRMHHMQQTNQKDQTRATQGQATTQAPSQRSMRHRLKSAKQSQAPVAK